MTPVSTGGFDPSLPALQKTENKWKIGGAGTTQALGETAKKIKGILNKVTAENYERLCGSLMELVTASVTTVGQLTEVVRLIFDKALTEPSFGHLYADLCVQVNDSFPSLKETPLDPATGAPLCDPATGAPLPARDVTFKRILLNKCQVEFEEIDDDSMRAAATAAATATAAGGAGSAAAEEAEAARMRLKARKIGNIKFIGELFKRKMLSEKIIHMNCIHNLLSNLPERTEEEFEALCKLFISTGPLLDHDKAKEHMDGYFTRLKNLLKPDVTYLSSRLRFMIQDVIELRARKWRSKDGSKPAPAILARPAPNPGVTTPTPAAVHAQGQGVVPVRPGLRSPAANPVPAPGPAPAGRGRGVSGPPTPVHALGAGAVAAPVGRGARTPTPTGAAIALAPEGRGQGGRTGRTTFQQLQAPAAVAVSSPGEGAAAPTAPAALASPVALASSGTRGCWVVGNCVLVVGTCVARVPACRPWDFDWSDWFVFSLCSVG